MSRCRTSVGRSLLLLALLLGASLNLSHGDAPSTEALLFDANPKIFQAVGSRGWGLAVSADGKLLASCSGQHNEPGEIVVRELLSGKIRLTTKHVTGIRSVAIDSNRRLVAGACFDNLLRIFDLDTGILLATGTGHTAGVNAVAFSHGGRTIVTGSLDKTVKTWTLPEKLPLRSRSPIWHLPAELKPFASLEEHTNPVFGVAVSHDGRTIVSGGSDNLARVWDMPQPGADGKLVVKKSRLVLRGHARAIEAVAISRDGRQVATGSWDAEARIWDLVTGEQIARFAGHNAGVMGVAFSPDGNELATGAGNSGTNQPGQVRRFDIATGSESAQSFNPASPVREIAYLPDGKAFAYITEDRTVDVQSAEESKSLLNVKPPPGPGSPQIVLAVAWSPGGSLLAVAGENRHITLFDAEGKLQRDWPAHDDVIAALAWSPNGNFLASASHDGTVRVWDLAAAVGNNVPVRVLKGHTNWVLALAYTADGSKLASTGQDRSIRIWNPADESGKAVLVMAGQGKGRSAGHSASVRSLMFTRDGAVLVSAGADRTIRFWNTSNGEEVGLLRGHKGVIRSALLSPDERLLATAGEDRVIKLWSITRKGIAISGNERSELTGMSDMVSTLAFSPSGRTLACGAWNGLLHIWDVGLARQRTMMSGHGDAIAAMSWSQDGSKLATGGYDKQIRVWKAAAAPTPPVVAYQHPDPATCVALSRDGNFVVTGDFGGTVRIFDRFTGKQRREIGGAHAGGVTSVAFAPEGQVFASGGKDNLVRIWTSTGERRSELGGHSAPVRRVAYSPDGQWLASAGDDKSIIVRNARTGADVCKITGHIGAILALAFSPDSKTLASAGADRSYRLWNTSTWAVRYQSPANSPNGEFRDLAFSPDSKTLALAHDQEQIITPDGELQQAQYRSILMVDASTGQPKPALANIFVQPDVVTSLAYTGDGANLVVGGRDMNVRLISANDGQAVRAIRSHQGAIAGLAVDPLRDQVVSASDDRTAKLWSFNLQKHGPRATLAGQSGQVWFAEFAADGSMLATGGDDKVVLVRQGMPAHASRAFNQPFAPCFSIAASPTGTQFATGHGDGSIHLWDSAGKQIATFSGHEEIIWSLTYLDGGKKLLATSGSWNRRAEQPGEARLWDISMFADKAPVPPKMLRIFAGQRGTIYAAAVSPDGQVLATGSHDKTIRLWNLNSGAMLGELKGHLGGVRTLAFLPDGTLASGSHEESTWIIWDVKERKEKARHVLPRTASNINRIRVSPAGKTLVIVSHDPPPPVSGPQMVPLLEKSADVPVPPPPPTQVGSAQLATLYLWDVAGKKVIAEARATNRILDADFSPDGSMLVTGGGVYSEFGEVMVWNATTLKHLGTLHGHNRWLEAVAFTRDGRVISGGGNNIPIGLPAAGRKPRLQPGELRLWSISGIQPELQLAGHTGYVSCSAFSPNGAILATGSGDKSVSLWDLSASRKAGKPVRTILNHEHALRAIAFSPNGELLATGDDGGIIKIWNAKSGAILQTIQATKLAVYSLSFSAHQPMLLVGIGNWRERTTGEIQTWNTQTWKQSGSPIPLPAEVWSARYSPDGQSIAVACGDAKVRLVDPKSRAVIRTLAVPATVRSLGWSSDGRWLAACHGTDQEPTARVWETDTWTERPILAGHKAMVFSVRFSPDQQTIATASKDGTVKLWDVPSPRTQIVER